MFWCFVKAATQAVCYATGLFFIVGSICLAMTEETVKIKPSLISLAITGIALIVSASTLINREES
ncbi:MAG: hypothetical protein A3D35_02365 [Candidatus Staskawiczbacteria bacterium RIFCSPHIGHO2_02_FULL_34_9]|uniref:Uncharacterized protein n=1 Tax=Candidatus Staskawiczbacteria bacterium RIFCSPHIGHO2_02_FULL_34_9 TaxID=1802206 RepID=A0A1G2HYV8_9BACT|nr:MAG: hypothetical protein A3D35_02365 [Candidatus Staskawiczbacteria bacterium RIFCSPHIGHO2_02_FULL_34_9]